jgi:tRNA A-37 threonylcarbamoyl transferase component Bud32
VPVEVIIEKIVEKVVHVPQLVTVDKRNDVLVKQIEVQSAKEIVNHIQKIPEIYEIVHEKPVPLIQTV